MRITHVVHQYVPDHVAGTELYTHWLAQSQATMGHQVAVFAPLNRAGSGELSPSIEAGVRVYRRPVGPRSPSKVFLDTFRQPQLVADFAAVLAEEAPDIVHIEHLMGLPAAIGAHLQTAGVPYVIFLHDYWYGCANGQLLTNDTEQICDGPEPGLHNCGRCAVARAGLTPAAGALGPLLAPLMRRRNNLLAAVYQGAACIIAPNDFVRQTYQQMGFTTDHMVTIPMGVEAPPVTSGLPREKRPGDPLRLGYIGSISPQKGIHVLVEAVNRLPPDILDVAIYGDMGVFPDYAAELQRLANHPGLIFGGRLSRAEVWSTLAGLDACVFPTLWYEASPFIIREAFAAGVPIIASGLGAPAHMIVDGVDGRLFPPGDAAALAGILEDLAARPAQLVAMRDNIRRPPSLDDHAQAIEALYLQVVAGSFIKPKIRI